jgi:tRNA(Ile)-lysidine synthase
LPQLLPLLLRTIRRHTLLPAGTRVLVALSGGSDSVALTLLLLEAAPRIPFEVAALAHFNHRLRETAARDETFCRDLASRLGLPIRVTAEDVREYAAAERLTIEDAARRLRYDFLRREAQELGATRIAVGHTQDDQAETFLLKLVRGAGATGLGAIYPRRDQIVRPLLDVTRAELRQYLASRDVSWVEDETNEVLDTPRNRLRHVVLPELVRTYGGDVRRSLARAAELIREDGEFLDELARTVFARVAVCSPGTVEIDARRLRAEPLPVRRRVLLHALRAAAGGREAGFTHVQLAMDVLTGEAAAADVPGGRLELRRGTLVLRLRTPDVASG